MTELPEKNVPFVNPRAAHDFRGRTCSIVSVGSYVPERRLSNAELEKLVDTSDEWITTRTGIKERRLAADDQFTSDLAAEAAKKALEKADIDPEAIDFGHMDQHSEISEYLLILPTKILRHLSSVRLFLTLLLPGLPPLLEQRLALTARYPVAS